MKSFHTACSQQGWVTPAYGGGSLVNLVASVKRALGGASSFAPLDGEDAESLRPRGNGSLVLLLLDGLGDGYLRSRGRGSALLAARRRAITSVFPSTTAAAITTLMTGLAPAEHGLNGWVTRGHAGVGLFEPLPMVRCADGREIRGFLRQRRLSPYRTLYQDLGRRSVVISPTRLTTSTYTLRHARGAELAGYDSLADVPELVRAALGRLPAGGLVYVYVPHFDSAAHDFGMASEAVHRVFLRIDRCFAALREVVDERRGVLCATADHGLIDAPLEDMICLGADPEIAGMLALPLWGERRAAFCALRPGCQDSFAEALEARWPGRLAVLTAAQVREAGLLGTGLPHRDLDLRLGDCLLLPFGQSTVVSAASGADVHPLAAVHGGLSADEMDVPLVVFAP